MLVPPQRAIPSFLSRRQGRPIIGEMEGPARHRQLARWQQAATLGFRLTAAERVPEEDKPELIFLGDGAGI